MKNKLIEQISKIISKRYDIFTKNFIFSFQMQEKTVNVPEFEFDKF